MTRIAGPLATAAAAFTLGCMAQSAPPTDIGGGLAVLERTKSTRATYALYSRAQISGPSGQRAEWGAEFHSGTRHRVETAMFRVVADCSTGAGAMMNVATGEVIRRPDVGDSACGIAMNSQVASVEALGEVATAFGPADRIRVTDAMFERTYDVSRNGVLVRGVYSPLPAMRGKADSLENVAVAIEETLPAADIFDEASLDRFLTPDRFRNVPARPSTQEGG